MTMAHHVVFVGNPIAAVHVARKPGDVQRFAAGITLDHRHHFGGGAAFVHQAAHPQHGLQAERDFCLHVRKFLLYQLVRRQRPAELFSFQRVVARRVPAEFGGAERPPGNAVTRLVQTAKRTFEPFDVRQQIFFRDKDVVQDDFAGYRDSQAELAFDLRRGKTLHAAFENEPANDVPVFLCPYDEDVGNRRIGDPHLRALEQVATIDFARASDHATGVRTEVGLGQAECPEEFAGGKPGQVFLALRLGAVGVDRIHGETGLHAHHRAITRIHPFDLSGNQSVADVVYTRAAVAFERRSEEAKGAHLRKDLAIEPFQPVREKNARHELVLAIGARGVPDHALFVIQLLFEQQRILPAKRRAGERGVHAVLLF